MIDLAPTATGPGGAAVSAKSSMAPGLRRVRWILSPPTGSNKIGWLHYGLAKQAAETMGYDTVDPDKM